MTFPTTSRQTAILAAILCGTTASADVTAQQVWDNWSEQTAIYGEGFSTGDETMSGDTLTISDVQISMSDDEATVTAMLGDIALTENGNGTVTITMAETYPIKISTTPNFGDPVSANISVSQSNMELTVSGDPEAMVYDLSADAYTIALDSLEGAAKEELAFDDTSVSLLDIAGTYSVMTDNLTRIAYDMTVGAVDLDLSMRETAGDGRVVFNGDAADMAMTAKISAPIDMDMAADTPPFIDGLAFDGGYSVGNIRYIYDVDIDGEAMSGNMSTEGGNLEANMDLDGARYFGEFTGIEFSTLAPNDFPFPIEGSLAKYGMEMLIPLSQSDDGPRDARIAFDITELVFGDTIWNLIDPSNILPREPMTIALGLDAQVTPFFDFLDPAQQQAAAMSDVPGELNGAQITELTVRGAGAEITGEGAFTFDNSDLTSFDGLPRPEGKMSFAINGINGLVDNLIQMGLIPQEEAMMPRMMLGMFATPVGDDMLTSTIEVNSEGHILANGQRLR